MHRVLGMRLQVCVSSEKQYWSVELLRKVKEKLEENLLTCGAGQSSQHLYLHHERS